jgi:hypothetical protein
LAPHPALGLDPRPAARTRCRCHISALTGDDVAFRISINNDRAAAVSEISSSLMGTTVEETWGDDDYEFWVDVPAAALHKLLFTLLREKYSSRGDAVDEFREFCKKEGIEYSWDSRI